MICSANFCEIAKTWVIDYFFGRLAGSTDTAASAADGNANENID